MKIAVAARPHVITMLDRVLTVADVAWTATSAEEAVQQCVRQTPDLLLLDLVLPDATGVSATRRIMASTPCPVLILADNVEGQTSLVFDALGAGALDAVSLPAADANANITGADAFRAKIATMHRLLGRAPDTASQNGHAGMDANGATACAHLVVIGASAGGPAALAVICELLPPQLPACIVIVQHIDVYFAPGMAQWLTHLTGREVQLVREGEVPACGRILLAGTTDHLVLNARGRFSYAQEPRNVVHRPSVDVFFESVARYWEGATTAVLLTGMGRDGARGMHTLRAAGALTIAQDRATSAVYGMPKAALESGAAAEVLPLDQIAARITSAVTNNTGRRGHRV